MQSNNSELHRSTPGRRGFQSMQSFCSSSSYHPLRVSAISETTPSPRERALAVLRNYKEAGRRTEKINSHLNKLRNLLPCNSKTDKAYLLAKVVQHVKELKKQASEVAGIESFPSATDEISVSSGCFPGDGRLIFKAYLCCDDRSDLMPDLIEILNSLHLTTLRAEMASLGGRTRKVFIVAADKDHSIESVNFLENALKSLLECSDSTDRSKRRQCFARNAASNN